MNVYQGENGPVQFRPPPPVKANPGPPARGSYAGNRSSGPGQAATAKPYHPPADIFAGYTGPAIDAASQIAQNFMALIGYPSELNVNQFALDVLKNGWASNPNAAYQYLFNNVPLEVRQANPGAAFGLSASAFQSRQDQLSSVFESLTGQTGWESLASADWMAKGQWALVGSRDPMQELYRQAFVGGWSQSQILEKLQSDDRFSDLRQSQPWLVQGQGERQAAQTYASIYGSAPVDKDTLAAWFRFNTGTTQLNRNQREAITVAVPTFSPTASR